MKMQYSFTKRFMVVIFCLLMFTAPSYAEEKLEPLLDGTSLTFHYPSGAGMDMSFDNGMAKYQWISGPREGRKAQDISYKSRKIGNEMYLVNWDQPDKPDFVTLVFDFKNNLMYSSAILGYGTDEKRLGFGIAKLTNVKR